MARNNSLAVFFCVVILAGHSASVSSAAPTDSQNAPKVFMQNGHSGLIQTMALSPNGELLAVGDNSGAIRVWDTALRKEVYRIGPLAMPVESLAWSTDGKTIYSGDARGFRGAHDPESEKTVGAWQPLRSGKEAWGIAVRRDGVIATGGLDPEIVIEGIPGRSEPLRLPAGDGTRALAFSADGTLLFSGNCEAVRAWDTQDWSVRWEYKPPDCLYALAPAPDGKKMLASFGRFMVGTKDPAIHVLSMPDGKLLGKMEGAEGITTSIRIAPDGRMAVTTAMAGFPTKLLGWVPDHHVRIWNLDRLALAKTLKGHAGNVMAAEISGDGRTVYTGSWDKTVRVWDTEGKLLATLEGKARLPEIALETADGKHIATAFRDGSVTFWDRMTGELSSYHAGAERAEDFGRVLAAQAWKGEMRVIALPGLQQHAFFQAATESKSLVQKRITAVSGWAARSIVDALDPDRHADGTPALVPEVTSAAFRNDECWLGISFTNTKNWSSRSQLSRWNCLTEDLPAASAIAVPGTVQSFAFTADGKAVVIGRREASRPDRMPKEERHVLSAHVVATGKLLWERPAAGPVKRLLFAPDGQTVFAATGFVIEVLDAANGSQKLLLQGHGKLVTALALHQGASVLASGSVDQTIALWDVKAGKLLRRLYNHTGDVYSLAWSEARRGDLISAGEDYTVRVTNQGGRGEELVQLAQFGKDDWVALSPEGYFAGSDEGIEQLGFRAGPRLYPLDQFYDAFYRPDLIRRKLRGEGIAGLAPLTVARALETPPPEIRVDPLPPATGAASLALRYAVLPRGGGVGEIRVFHNGKLIKTNAGARPLPDSAGSSLELLAPVAVTRSLAYKANASPETQPATVKGDVAPIADSITIRPVPGRNEISIVAFNAANNVQGRLRRVLFDSSLPAEEPRMHLMAVGINRFRTSQWRLSYAAKDAADFVSLVRNRKDRLPIGALGEVALLTDAAATKGGILGSLQTMAERMKPTDVFVLFLATHGVFAEEVYALVTHDFDGKVSAASTITASELLESLRKIPAQRMILVVDTCHAGGIDQTLSGFYDSRMKLLARTSGLHVLASAETLEGAIDGYKGNGLFTHVLLDGVGSGNADLDGNRVVSVFELGAYGRRQTSAIARSLGYIQVPVLMRVGNDIPVFRALTQ